RGGAALPAAAAGGAGQPGVQRRGIEYRLPRIPGPQGRPHRPAQDVHRHPDIDLAAGGVRRHRQRLPDRRQPGAAAAGA
nr:hypothetical protein [Tanacetum cinerariifolium]